MVEVWIAPVSSPGGRGSGCLMRMSQPTMLPVASVLNKKLESFPSGAPSLMICRPSLNEKDSTMLVRFALESDGASDVANSTVPVTLIDVV
jgi:hypothetical protein